METQRMLQAGIKHWRCRGVGKPPTEEKPLQCIFKMTLQLIKSISFGGPQPETVTVGQTLTRIR